MATGGGRISLPLAVGVDRSHPQAARGGSRPPPVAGSILFFFWSFTGETKMATRGGRISLPWPLGWIAATPSGWIYLFFFFLVRRKSHQR
jgi:hypothetical protein